MLVTPETVKLFRKRFFGFDDGVVRVVELRVRSFPRSCLIEVECMDRDAPGGWSLVTLTVHSVTACRFQLGKTAFEVLSGGIQFVWRDNVIYVVVDAHPNDGEDVLPDLTQNTAYVAGASCEWRSAFLDPTPRETVNVHPT